MAHKQLLLMAAAIIVSSCNVSDDNTGISEADELVQFAANFGNGTTRTTMDAQGNVTWSSTDKIYVNTKLSGTPTALTTDAYGNSIATFTVSAPGTPYCALYPSSVYSSYTAASKTFTISLPSTQLYRDDTSFDNNVNPSIAYAPTGNDTSGRTRELYFNNTNQYQSSYESLGYLASVRCVKN
jgi:hypothetical protein